MQALINLMSPFHHGCRNRCADSAKQTTHGTCPSDSVRCIGSSLEPCLVSNGYSKQRGKQCGPSTPPLQESTAVLVMAGWTAADPGTARSPPNPTKQHANSTSSSWCQRPCKQVSLHSAGALNNTPCRTVSLRSTRVANGEHTIWGASARVGVRAPHP